MHLVAVIATIAVATLAWFGLQAFVTLSSDDCFTNNSYDHEQRLVQSETICN